MKNAKLRTMGFGDQGQAFALFGTTLKTMHDPMDTRMAK